ncbi:MAG: hypothetical protein WDO71_22335 [Bacteroidota bacterium]
MRSVKVLLILLCFHIGVTAQKPGTGQDTASRSLDSILLISYLNQNIVRQLPTVHGAYIFSGKKTEVIDLRRPLLT